MMIKIKIFSDFCSSEGAIRTFINLNELEKDEDYNKNYCFTTEEDYTHAILMNKAMPSLRIPRENVIGLAFEPREFLNITPIFNNYAQRYIGRYLIGDASGLGEPFISHFGYMWHTALKKDLKNKRKKMSLMVSEKKTAPGHIYRYKLAEKILIGKLDVDIYGRGCNLLSEIYPNDNRVKGEFKCSKEMLEEYEYHIAIENFESPDYFSEKLMDPLICNTVPIYLGCKNHKKYFNNMVISLSGDINTDIDLIIDLLNKDREYDIDLEKVEKTISIKNVIELFLR
jgi:hypothetical protein